MLFILFLFVVISAIIVIYWLIRYSQKTPIKDEKLKFKYLENKYNKLEGTVDEEHKMKIKMIEIDEPLNKNENWKVTKKLSGGLILPDKSIVIFDKTDNELELEMNNKVQEKINEKSSFN